MTLLLQFLCADSLQADHIQTILDRREDAKKLSAAAYFATGLFLIGRELIKRGLDIQSEQPNVAELCARLVRLGANVNPTLNNKLESTSRPPIVWVALRGRTALCQALIDAGAQFSAGETSISNDRILTPLSPDVYITCDPLEKRFTVATEALR